jgi:hypothetical protein
MTDTLTVEIPLEVRDNSETVTDYAFMRHRSPGRGVVTVVDRDRSIDLCTALPSLQYTHHQWHDTNQRNGQRCRFDMIVSHTGHVVYLFHTELWTRVACHMGDDCYYYAAYYVREDDPREEIEDQRPFCDEHTAEIIGAPLVLTQDSYIRDDGIAVRLSERLLVGQH